MAVSLSSLIIFVIKFVIQFDTIGSHCDDTDCSLFSPIFQS
jgi:hypothetical protein